MVFLCRFGLFAFGARDQANPIPYKNTAKGEGRHTDDAARGFRTTAFACRLAAGRLPGRTPALFIPEPPQSLPLRYERFGIMAPLLPAEPTMMSDGPERKTEPFASDLLFCAYGRIFVPTEAVWLAANENHRNQNEAPILTKWVAYATIIDELRTMPLLRRSVLLRLRRRGVVCRHETHDAKTFETGRNSE